MLCSIKLDVLLHNLSTVPFFCVFFFLDLEDQTVAMLAQGFLFQVQHLLASLGADVWGHVLVAELSLRTSDTACMNIYIYINHCN